MALSENKRYLDQVGLAQLVKQIQKADTDVAEAAELSLTTLVGSLGNASEAQGETPAVKHTVKSYVDAKVAAATSTADDAVKALDATVYGSMTADGQVREGQKVGVKIVEEDGKLTSVTVATKDIASAATLEKLQGVVGYSDINSAATDGTQKTVKARLEVLEGANTVEGSVAKALKDAKDYADGLDEAMDGRVDKLEATHATKEDGSFKTVAEEASAAAAAIVADAPDAFNTLMEIADWIQKDADGNAGTGFDAANRIVALETKTAGLTVAQGADVTVANAIAKAVSDEAALARAAEKANADAIGKAKVGETAGTGLTGRIEVLEGLVGTDVATQISTAINKLDSEKSSSVVTTGVEVTVKETDGKIESVTVSNKDIASAALLGTKTDANTAETAFGYIAKEADDRATAVTGVYTKIGEVPAKVGETATDTVVAYVNAKVAAEESARATAITTKVESLDATVGATTVDTGKHVAVRVVETDGMLTGLTVTESDIASADALSNLKAIVGYSADTLAAGTAPQNATVNARLAALEALTPATEREIADLFGGEVISN